MQLKFCLLLGIRENRVAYREKVKWKSQVRFGARARETYQRKRWPGVLDRVHLGKEALEEVRCDLWRQMRKLASPEYARKFADARWALLKNPSDLTERQNKTLYQIKRTGGKLWRAYEMKESLRALFAGDLSNDEVSDLLERWCSRAARSLD
jgi:hypothetical protein